MRKSDVLIKPILSEKVLKNVSMNWYGFVVARKSDKIGVKYAVEKAFGVDVIEIRLLAQKGKKIRDTNIKNRLIKNKRADLKKAYVRIKEGQSINLLGDEGTDKPKKKTKKIVEDKSSKKEEKITKKVKNNEKK